MAGILSRTERGYAQIESSFGIVPNSSGTATVGNSNAFRFINMTLNNDTSMIERPDKTGTRSAQIGVAGRRRASWSLSASIAPNGVAGVAPDLDPLFHMTFGQAGAATSGTATVTAATNATPIVITATNSFADGDVVFISGVAGNTAANGVWMIASVSGSGFTLVGSEGNGTYTSGGSVSRVGYKYTLSDSIVSGSLWSFRQPSTADQRVAAGALVSEATFEFGGDVSLSSFRGPAKWVLGSNQYSGADSYQKSGLTAFPTEPGSPTTNGGIIAGFTGKVAIGNHNIATLRTANVRVVTDNQLIEDQFGSYYARDNQGGVRLAGMSFSLYEDDSAAYAALVAAANAKTPVTIPLFSGTTNGSIFGVIMKNVQLATPTSEENLRFIANFADSSAHSSSLTNRDELIAVFI